MLRSHCPSLTHRPLSAGGPQTFHLPSTGILRHTATWTSVWPWIVFLWWTLLVDPQAFVLDGSLIQRILTGALSLLSHSVGAASIASAHADRNCRLNSKEGLRIWLKATPVHADLSTFVLYLSGFSRVLQFPPTYQTLAHEVNYRL